MRGAALISAVYAGRWVDVAELLRRGVSDADHRMVAKVAGQRLESGALASYILPHSRDDQLDELLIEVVGRGQWCTVGQLLKRQHVGDKEQRKWAMEEAGKRAKDEHLAAFIVPWCDPQNYDSLLTVAVNRGLWESVGLVLERGVSEGLKKWAVEESSSRADDSPNLVCILRHCGGSYLASVLKEAVRRGLWLGVSELLKHLTDDSLRAWAVSEASERGSDARLTGILPRCTDGQLEAMVQLCVDKRLWQCVGQLLQRGVKVPLHDWAVMMCSKHASEMDIVDHILPCCADGQVHSCFTSVPATLHCGRPSEVTTQGAKTLGPSTAAVDSRTKVLCYCGSDSLVFAMLDVVMKRGLWGVVASMIPLPCFTEDKRRWIFIKASEHASELCFKHRILPHCSKDHADQVLPGLVKRGLWDAVAALLSRGLNETPRAWVAEAAVCGAKPGQLAIILPACLDERSAATLYMKVIRKHRWTAVSVMLGCPLIPLDKRWAAEEVSKVADEKFLLSDVFKQYPEENVDAVLRIVLGRRLWNAVAFLIRNRSVSSDQCGAAFEVAVESVSESILLRKMAITTCCPDACLHYVLTTLVKRGCWEAVSRLLIDRHFSTEDRGLVLAKVSKAAKEKHVELCVAVCPAEYVDSVVSTIVRRAFWQALGTMLRFSDREHARAVETASKHAPEQRLLRDILPYCPESCAESVIKILLKRRLWWSVSLLLSKHSISERLRGKIAEDASQKANKALILLDIMRHCPDSKVELVIPKLFKREKWMAFGLLWTRKISDTQRIFLVKMALKRAKRPTFTIDKFAIVRRMILLMGVENLDRVMSNFARKDQWHYICLVMKISDFRGLLKVSGASDLSTGDSFFSKSRGPERFTDRDICHTADSDGTTLLHVLCASGLWRSVSAVVNRGADPLHTNVYGRGLLCFALFCGRRPEKMLAECLKLGISTHQPYITVQGENKCLVQRTRWNCPHVLYTKINKASPFECAILRGSPLLMEILFECGACSLKEVGDIHLKCVVEHPHDDDLPETMKELRNCLEKLSTSPRSLKSSCRLLISHCLGVGSHRETKVAQLSLPDNLKNYLQFSDIVERLCDRAVEDTCYADFDEFNMNYMSYAAASCSCDMCPTLMSHQAIGWLDPDHLVNVDLL